MASAVVFVELVSREQGMEVIDLLRFPSGALLPLNCRHKLKRIKSVKPIVNSYASIDTAVAAIEPHSLYWLEAQRKFKPHEISGCPHRLIDVTQMWNLSPTSTPWYASKMWEDDEIAADIKTYRYVETREYNHKNRGIAQQPTWVRVDLQFDQVDNMEAFEEWLLGALSDSFDEHLARQDIGGAATVCCSNDCHGANPGFTWSLRDHPKALWQVGHAFDKLYTFMIGPYHTCSQIRDSTSEGVEIKRCGNGEDCQLAVAMVSRELLKATINGDDWPWLMKLNEAFKARNPNMDPEPGEYPFGVGGITYTVGHERYLIENDLIPPRPRDPVAQRPFPLVEAKYCRLLGIDPDEMILGKPIQPSRYEEFKAAVDRAYDSMPDNVPLGARIYKAHLSAWEQTGQSALIPVVRDQWFSDQPLR